MTHGPVRPRILTKLALTPANKAKMSQAANAGEERRRT